MLKKRNVKKIIVISLLLIITILIIGTKENTKIVSAIKNDSAEYEFEYYHINYIIELSEEYTKNDFIISEDGYTLEGLTKEGKEKLIKNNHQLVIDGNVIGRKINNISGRYSFGIREKNENETDEEYNEYVKNNQIYKVEIKNLDNFNYVGQYSFYNQRKLDYIDVSSIKTKVKFSRDAFSSFLEGYNWHRVDIVVAYRDPLKYDKYVNDIEKKVVEPIYFRHAGPKYDKIKIDKNIKKLSYLEEELKNEFINEEEYEKWLKSKNYYDKYNSIISKYKGTDNYINREVERIEKLEPWEETNKQILIELKELEKAVIRYSRKPEELKELYQEALIERLKEKIKGLEGKITELNNDNNSKDQEIEKLKKEKEALEKEKETLVAEKSKLEKEIEKLKGEIEKLKNESKDTLELEKKIKELEVKVKELEEKLKKCGESKKELEEKILKLTSELDKTNTEKDEKIKKLEEEKKELEKRKKELEENNCCGENKGNKNLDKKEENNNSKINSNNIKSKRFSNSEKNKPKNLPYAGSGSVILLSLITIGAIIYTKRVMKRK